MVSVFTVDEGFYDSLFPCLNSLFFNTKINHKVYIIYSNWETVEEKKNLLQKTFPKQDIIFKDCIPIFNHLSVQYDPYLMCLFIPFLIDEEKAFVHDTDIIFNGNISYLYNTNIDTFDIGAFKSSCSPNQFIRWIRQNKSKTGVFHGGKILDAGSVLMNIHRLNKRGYQKRIIRLMQNFPINDMILYNAYCQGGFVSLNRTKVIYRSDAIPVSGNLGDYDLVHYTEKPKPWDITSKTQIEKMNPVQKKKYNLFQNLWEYYSLSLNS